MKDPHTEQWESLKKRYSSIDTPEMIFRAECIDNLLISAKEKELNHFK